jgi:hypothetical protein
VSAIRELENFRDQGFVIARGVFSAQEIARFRELLEIYRAAAFGTAGFNRDPNFPHLLMLRGDIPTVRELRGVDYVVFDARLVECLKRLLGPSIVYHGDSTVQFGEGPRGFHKDNADRNDPSGADWSGEYGVVRVGIYLQDHSVHSGGLKVRLRSHRFVSHHTGRAVNLATRPGDVVFWYLTTSHSGNAVRLRGVRRLCVHPRLERLVPPVLRIPEECERMAFFCSFGAPGPHLDRYIKYQSEREDVQLHWQRCRVGGDFAELAAARQIVLRCPSAEFGKRAQN